MMDDGLEPLSFAAFEMALNAGRQICGCVLSDNSQLDLLISWVCAY